VNKDVVVREAAQAGYELRDSQDFVKADGMDYFRRRREPAGLAQSLPDC
jgi:hypothetical protein